MPSLGMRFPVHRLTGNVDWYVLSIWSIHFCPLIIFYISFLFRSTPSKSIISNGVWPTNLNLYASQTVDHLDLDFLFCKYSKANSCFSTRLNQFSNQLFFIMPGKLLVPSEEYSMSAAVISLWQYTCFCLRVFRL